MPSRLVEFEIPRPGIYGVNTSASGDVMPKEYSVKTTNLVFSDEGYTESRPGSTNMHSQTIQAALSAAGVQRVRSIFQTVDENGADLLIIGTEDGICKLASGTLTNITGTITAPTAGNWKFVNLNDQIIGFQSGHNAIILATPSSGTFADITFTGADAPLSSGQNAQDIYAGFGRLWVLDGDILRYSTILAPTNFAPTGTGNDAGYFDLNAVYLNGQQSPVAITEFNGNLILFDERHITVWEYPWNPNGTGAGYGGGYGGSSTDPAMGVLETIGGVGCIARDSIQHTQNDLVFLSEQGVTSLSRVVQEKSMPIQRLSDNIRQDLLSMIRNADPTTIYSTYLEGKGTYFIGSGDESKIYLIDVAAPLPDGTYRATMWAKNAVAMAVRPQDRLSGGDDVWAAVYISDQDQYLSTCEGYLDYIPNGGETGSTYNITYESAWTVINEEFANNIKMPKKMGVVIKGSGAQSYDINLAFDYGDFTDSKARTGTAVLSTPSRYGVDTYGGTTEDSTTAYYGAAVAIKQSTLSGFGTGRIIKIKVTSTVNGSKMSLQRISINAKIGRHD